MRSGHSHCEHMVIAPEYLPEINSKSALRQHRSMPWSLGGRIRSWTQWTKAASELHLAWRTAQPRSKRKPKLFGSALSHQPLLFRFQLSTGLLVIHIAFIVLKLLIFPSFIRSRSLRPAPALRVESSGALQIIGLGDT